MDSFLALDPDLVIIAGDITQFGPCEDALNLLSRIEVPCFVVPGNCDPREILDSLEESEAVFGEAHSVSRARTGKISAR